MMRNIDHGMRPSGARRDAFSENSLHCAAPLTRKPSYILGRKLACARDMGSCAKTCLSGESKAPHCTDFALEPVENKQFLNILSAREVDIALSWGQGGKDRQKPCTVRGRQEQWYKEYWPSHSLHFWRLSAFRAVKTVLRCKSHRTLLQLKWRSAAAAFTSRPSIGRAFGSVRHFPLMEEVAHG